MKQYHTFEEIDERLRIIKLSREIHIENLKFKLNRVKTDMYPTNLLGNFKGSIQQMILTFAIQKLSRIFRRSH
ncbi:DUF6327 family protein [Maribacter sp. CXY002]|uniref:DUF6327 family protein n=1 Tax=Maribacter luteocoastalis TaxID=3407671 RepID=UPI003B679CD8